MPLKVKEKRPAYINQGLFLKGIEMSSLPLSLIREDISNLGDVVNTGIDHEGAGISSVFLKGTKGIKLESSLD